VNKRSIIAAVSFSVLILSSAATADENKQFQLKGPVKAIGVEKIYDDITLTVDQIKTCLVSADKLEEMSAGLTGRLATFPDKLSKISALSGKLQSAQAYLDKNPTTEVNDDAKMSARNEKVADYNKMVTDYNQITEAYSNETGNYTADNTTYALERAYFKETCEGKHFYAEDMNVVTSAK